MTPGEQITLMKIIETRDACQNQDLTPKDLKVVSLQLQCVALLMQFTFRLFPL